MKINLNFVVRLDFIILTVYNKNQITNSFGKGIYSNRLNAQFCQEIQILFKAIRRYRVYVA